MTFSSLTRREFLTLAGAAGLAAPFSRGQTTVQPPTIPFPPPSPPRLSPYSQRILSLHPAGYWRLGEPAGRAAYDWSPHRRHGAYHGAPTLGQPGAIPGDPDRAVGLRGSAYVQVPDSGDFSISASGLTVEVWVRPDLLDFAGEGAKHPYVHWLGKGEKGRFEWGFRFYRKTSDRPNRLSAYAWPASGGEGAGAYFEELLTPGRWVHLVAVYQPPGPGAGVQIYRDGVFKKGPPDTPTLYSSYNVTPAHGAAPLRLGTRDLVSFLTGGLDEVAVYPRCLTAAEIRGNHRAATAGTGLPRGRGPR